MVTPEEAEAMAVADYRKNLAALRRLYPDLVEVEEGHFVKPGEVAELEDGTRFVVPLTAPPTSSSPTPEADHTSSSPDDVTRRDTPQL